MMRKPPQSTVAPSPSPSSAMAAAVVVPAPAIRLTGKVLKKNAGFLRQWIPRTMFVTSDGFLRYEKKKGESTRTKETDLVKSEIGGTLTRQSGHYCINLQCGQSHFLLGFESKTDAKLWQEVMLEVADENATGRRLWIAQMRRALTLTLRDRRELVDQMGERDWLTEWNFCWTSLKDRRGDDFNGRRRRLKRLYAIWLQFHLFAEVVAEIYFSTVQSQDKYRAPSTRDHSFQQSDHVNGSNGSDRQSNHSSMSAAESLATPSSDSWVFARASSFSATQQSSDDVDVMEMKTIKIAYGSKTWRGAKRLQQEMAELARFRQKLEEMVSFHGLQDAMDKFPTFPLLAAFSIRGVVVVARAQPWSDEMEDLQVDRRDVNELISGLRLAGCLSQFSYGEFPDVWVRKSRSGRDGGELIRVASRYDDVLQSSLRSSMVHGVLLRAGVNQKIEVLSSHDVDEFVNGKLSRWTPFLDLLYYHLDPSDNAERNPSAKKLLLKKPKSVSCKGDMVIAVDADRCRLPLNLKEAFVQRYQIELLPVLRRLRDVKHSHAQMAVGIHALQARGSGVATSRAADPSATIIDDLELTIKRLLRRHIKDIATKLVTMGDVTALAGDRSSTGGAPSSRLHGGGGTSAYVRQSSPTLGHGTAIDGFRRRGQSSVDVTTSSNGDRSGNSKKGDGLYVIDAIHLRRVLKQHGVNMRFMPLVFAYSNSKQQPGVQILLAAQIMARLAKKLFQYRLFHDQNADKSRWRSRKSRLIDFICQIMRGVHDDNEGGAGSNQFWCVDAPLWLLLGPFASSIALSESGVIQQPLVMVASYRKLIQTNPSVLFNCLLRNFEAHLANGYLPSLDETKWVSLPFLKREGQLNFFDEAVDPKLALTYHSAWLSAWMLSFRLQFDSLQRLYLDGGGQITAKSELQSPQTFFSALQSQFRLSLAIPAETRLESAMVHFDTQQSARQCIVQAHSALREFRLDDARNLVRHAWEDLATTGAHASFPLEMKFYMLTIMAMSDRDTLLSPTKRTTAAPLSAIGSKWTTLLSWLRHFYRPANRSQMLASFCSHPLVEAIRNLDGGAPRRKQGSIAHHTPSSPSSSFSSSSFRAKLEHTSELELWDDLALIVDRQFHLTAAPSTFTRGNATTLSSFSPTADDRTNSMPNQQTTGRTLYATDVVARSASESAKHNRQHAAASLDLALPAPGASSWDRVLRMLEQLFMPTLAETSGCWLLPGYLFDPSQVQQARFPPTPPLCDEIPAPGLALMWGRSTGLSLDDESKLSHTTMDGTASRPRSTGDVSLVALPMPLRRVMQVSCGYRHTALITSGDNLLYTFGYGECGRLGHGDELSVERPKEVEYFSSLLATPTHEGERGVCQVACGREHTMVVLNNGDLFGFGWAEAGRLGTGESGGVPLPSKVVSLKDVHAVACGREHTLALTRSGGVFAFGAGFGGRLGNGDEKDEDFPVAIRGFHGEEVVAVDAGECHSCALTKQGQVFTWGFGSSGALGTGSRENALVPTQVTIPSSQLVADEQVVGVACASYHTLAYTSHGQLYGWGDAAAGQLGDKLLETPDMVVLTPQRIKLPRSASFQEDGMGVTTHSMQRIHAIACGTFTSAVSTTEGKLLMWGSPAAGNGAKLNPDDAKIKQVGAISEFPIAQIACGAFHTVVVTKTPEFE